MVGGLEVGSPWLLTWMAGLLGHKEGVKCIYQMPNVLKLEALKSSSDRNFSAFYVYKKLVQTQSPLL